MHSSSQSQIHGTLQLVLIGLLIGGSFWILQPFLLALLWATIIVVATWPLLLRVQSMLNTQDGQILAFALLKLEPGFMYECRWEHRD